MVKQKKSPWKVFVVGREVFPGCQKANRREKPPSNGFLYHGFFFVYHKVYHAAPSINKNGARLRSYIWLPRHQR